MNTKTELSHCRPLRLLGELSCLRSMALLLCLGIHARAQTYTTLHSFGTDNGGFHPWDLMLSGTNLYGTTRDGGRYGIGTVFKLNTDGSGYSVLKNFGHGEGTGPPTLLLSGTTLFGTAHYGGSNGCGTVFKLGTDGSDFSLLHTFSAEVSSTNDDGAFPSGGLVASGTTLYGTALAGGHNGYGTIFRVNVDGGGFTVLRHFGGLDGMSPAARLVLSGSTLFGTTKSGGGGGYGTVFKINTDGTGYTVLKSFSLMDGAVPESPLVLSGSTLYGTCDAGGAFRFGTVFKVNTDGTGFAVLRSFNDSDGRPPAAGLVSVGGVLYGTTSAGGSYQENGEIFQINTDGSGFALLKSFTGTNGANPYTTLVADGTTLYGATVNGGRLAGGVLFSFSLLPGVPKPDPFINTQPESQWVNAGETVQFSVDTSGASPLSYQWFRDGIALTDGGGVSGAQTATLTLSNLFHGAAGVYWVTVSNVLGSATSQVAILSVEDPFFDAQPFNETVFLSQTAMFEAAAGGTGPLYYQWLKDGLSLSDGGNISGARRSTLKLTNVSSNDSGVYLVVVSNNFGSLTSSLAALNVVVAPPAPGTLAVAEVSALGRGVASNADHITFSFGNAFTQPLYPEFRIFEALSLRPSDVGRLFPITQAEDPDFTPLVSILRNGTADWVGYEVWVGAGGGGAYMREYDFFWPLPEGSNGIDFQGYPIENISLLVEELAFTRPSPDETDFAFRAKIFVNSEPWPQPIIVEPPIAQTSEIGSPACFSVRAYGLKPFSYQWRLNGAPIIGETNRLLRLAVVQPTDAGGYSVVITNPVAAVSSSRALLNVIPRVERRIVPALTLVGQTGAVLHLENRATFDVSASWLTLDTVALTNPPQWYFDLTQPLTPQSFYRVWQSGMPAVRPSLNLPGMVPAITLAGGIGDSLRLDYINQFGPIDAWVTNLTTVTLTNTSQLYFDTSVIGQPPRLYRIVPLP